MRVRTPLADLTVRTGRHRHWGWLEALLPRVEAAEGAETALAIERAAVGEAGAVQDIPEALVTALRSRAVPADAGDPAGAVQLAQRAVCAAPGDSALLLDLARLLRRSGNDRAAGAALRAAVLSDRDGALLGTWLGDAALVEPAPEPAPPAPAQQKEGTA
jgi:hypothetical protein